MSSRINYTKICNSLDIELTQYNDFITNLYINDEMSSIEIVEYIKDKTGVKMSIRLMQQLINKLGLSRDAKTRFNLAIKRGRVKWAYKSDKIKRLSIRASKRYKILERDNFKCVKCGATAQNTVLEVDHILALCNGGSNDLDNLQTLCHLCNVGKGSS